MDFYAKEPPTWAQDSFNHNAAERCGYCGAWCTVVRPGKTQCDNCDEGEWDRHGTFEPKQYPPMEVAQQCSHPAIELFYLRARCAELEALFDIIDKRIHEATHLWQKATGKTDCLPDLGRLLEWFMERQAELEGALQGVAWGPWIEAKAIARRALGEA